ncbi:hypothetical protein [Roseivirga misakiensis]|uniref:Uncharacterized protein n=1 Tax=Roseivirga misakiensis TaxID=1563681 RepID=A0A1E5T260_9BACT|nr:hypothetical protein [Roseivirga misakiensis]OEK05464.1 hypothetical protein BFP71_18955 [Roseivirga misakiensis]
MSKKKPAILKFIAELLIVFIGVYGAFELNRYQQAEREDKIRERYFNSFMSELVKLSADIRGVQKEIDKAILDFESNLADGDQPNPKPLNIYFQAPMLITKAGFNEDVFTQLDPGLAASLGGGYDNVQIVSQNISDFNDMCNRQLISNQPIQFYNRNGSLKPEFNWYLEGLKRLQRYMNNLSNMINGGAIPATEELIEGVS